jgi:hypothetical protein
MNIYQKIVEIRKSIDVFEKDAKGHNYKYVSGAQVLGKIKSKMDELGVVLEPHLLNQSHHLHTYKTKYSEITDFVVTGDMKMIWINADEPTDKIEIAWQMAGQQDDISKALGSGLTYSERYFLLKYFGVPTDEDDPDAKKKQETPKPKKQDENGTEIVDYKRAVGIMLMELYGKDNAPEELRKLTEFKGKDGNIVNGVNSLEKLSDARAQATYGKIKKIYEDKKSQGGKNENFSSL